MEAGGMGGHPHAPRVLLLAPGGLGGLVVVLSQFNLVIIVMIC